MNDRATQVTEEVFPPRRTAPGGGVGERGHEAHEMARRPAAFCPDERWLDAYEAQATAPMLRRCLPVATRCAQWIAQCGGMGGELRARELVQDALADTRMGMLAWDPESKPLEAHIIDAIRWRARDESRQRQRTVWLDEARAPELTDDSAWDREEAEAESERGARLLAELRERLTRHGDHEALEILHAYDEGAQTKADILSIANLSSMTYERVRARLCWHARQVKRASEALREETSEP